MTTISTQPSENFGGLKLIAWSESKDFASISYNGAGDVTDIVFNSGKGWDSGYFKPETMDLREVQGSSINGESYKIEITSFIPGESSSLVHYTEAMRYRRYLVLTQDYNGFRRLSGTLDAPLRFRIDFGTKSNFSQLKGATAVFYGESILRAAHISGSVLFEPPPVD